MLVEWIGISFDITIAITGIAISTGLLVWYNLWKVPSVVKVSNATDDDSNSNSTIARQGFSMKKIPSDLDVIVIGSGISGLSVAAILSKEGKKVLVLEQHDVAGGNMHTFVEKGFEFDTGLHYIGGNIGCVKSPLRRQMDYITNGNVQWSAMSDDYDVAIVCQPDGGTEKSERFPINKKWRSVLIPQLKKSFPKEHAAIDKHFDLVKQVEKWLPVYIAIHKLLPQWLGRRLMMSSRLDLFTKTTSSVLDSLTTNVKLKGVLTYMYGDFGEIPDRGAFVIHCLLWLHYHGGAYYPVGGPAVIAQSIIPVIERAGGKVLVRAPVSEIVINNNNTATGVIVKGETIMAKIIVSTVGVPLTYTELVPKKHQSVLLTDTVQKVLSNPKVASNVSLMSMFVGIEGNATELKLPNQNYWVFPSWDHNANWKKYVSEKNSVSLPAVFISFSSVKDSTYATRYPNKQVALVIAPSIFEDVQEYKSHRVKHRGKEYEALKAKYKSTLLNILIREFPQIKNKITFMDLGTAVTNDYYLGTHRGAVYGLSHTPERFEASMTMNNFTTPKTRIKNLYLSGQDVACCGITGALLGGYYTAGQISTSALIHTASMMI